MNKPLTDKILDQIPVSQIYRYLKNKNAPKKQTGGSTVGSSATSRKAVIESLTREIAK